MRVVVSVIWAIAFLVTLVGCIPYLIWMIRTGVKRRWKRLGFQLGVPMVIFSLLAAVSAVVKAYEYKQYLDGLYDTNVDLGTPVFEYHSARSFNGDGYSISVYEVPSSIRTRFDSADERLLTEFPKHPSYRDHWNFEPWHEAPFDTKFEAYLDFALSRYDADRAPGLAGQFEAIRLSLQRQGTYYAFFHHFAGDYPGDIDLFIVDLVGGRVYLINHNT